MIHTTIILDKGMREWLEARWQKSERSQVAEFDAAVEDHLTDVVTALMAHGFAASEDAKRQRRKISERAWNVLLEDAAQKTGLDRIDLLRACLRLRMKNVKK